MTTQDQYVERMKQQLEEWNRDIDELQDMAATAQAGARNRSQLQVQQVRAERDELRERLDQLEQASGEAGEDLKEGVDEAAASLKQALEDARKEFE